MLQSLTITTTMDGAVQASILTVVTTITINIAPVEINRLMLDIVDMVMVVVTVVEPLKFNKIL
jgi:hypothetical protein